MRESENTARVAPVRGMTRVKLVVIISIVILAALVAVFWAGSFVTKKFGRGRHPGGSACANNIQSLYNALSEYGIDMELHKGATVNIYQLAPRYIKKADTFICFSCGLMYGTNFIYGTVPVCPGNIPGHTWKPEKVLSL